MINIAVVGSREGFTYKEVAKVLDEQLATSLEIVTLISGGARGVDKYVEKYAKLKNIYIKVIRPISTSRGDYWLYRNVEIITLSDRVIAFWDGKSTGTKFVIDYSVARNKPIKVVEKY